ncbi:MAG: hypothetical protein OXQ31_19810 [Spirochaetaceae bacterium]|nr:hypothetical protein [Spirochaetaceae bacterium]
MTFREQSERMFAGVLVAAVLHGALLIAMHKVFDLRFEDYTRPLTVQLLAPEHRGAPVREERPLPPKQEETAPAVAVPKPAPQPVATPRPAAQAQPAPERATAQEPAPVRTQPRTESAPAEASASPVAAWTPALRQSVESAPVRGGGGLNAVTGDTVRQAEPRAAAAASAAATFTAQDAAQDDLPTTFKDGLALPVDDSVYARSASSRAPGASAFQGAGSDDSVPVVRDPGLSGRSRDASAPLTPVRMSGTPTASRADAPGTAGTEQGVPLVDSAPQVAPKPAPVDATVYGGPAAPSGEAADGGERLQDLDRALRASGSDSTASAGADQGASTAADGVAGPAVADARLPEGWNVSGSLGLRPLLKVVDPALPKRYPDEIVRSTVRLHISVDSQGLVKYERWEQDSGSTEINNKIIEALRQWRYEPVKTQDRVFGMVTIEIRTRSAEVAVSGQ